METFISDKNSFSVSGSHSRQQLVHFCRQKEPEASKPLKTRLQATKTEPVETRRDTPPPTHITNWIHNQTHLDFVSPEQYDPGETALFEQDTHFNPVNKKTLNLHQLHEEEEFYHFIFSILSCSPTLTADSNPERCWKLCEDFWIFYKYV